MVSLLTPFGMAREWKILEQMRCEPANVRFNDLFKVCEAHFGPARQSGSSHAIFKTPWQGDPRVTIQSDQGKQRLIRCGRFSTRSIG